MRSIRAPSRRSSSRNQTQPLTRVNARRSKASGTAHPSVRAPRRRRTGRGLYAEFSSTHQQSIAPRLLWKPAHAPFRVPSDKPDQFRGGETLALASVYSDAVAKTLANKQQRNNRLPVAGAGLYQ